MTPLPRDLADRNMPLPNVYLATVLHVSTGVHSFYLAADSSKAAVQKLRNYCAEHLGFRPYRTTTDIKLRRFLLGDYLENPDGLQKALEVAQMMGERSTVEALNRRMLDVQSVLHEVQAARSDHYSFDEVADALAAELRALDTTDGSQVRCA